jgi:hypothetical protein
MKISVEFLPRYWGQEFDAKNATECIVRTTIRALLEFL